MSMQVRSPGHRYPVGHDREGVTDQSDLTSPHSSSSAPTLGASAPASGRRGPTELAKVRIVSIAFLSDHRLLRNLDGRWGGQGDLLGDRYPKPEWLYENMIKGDDGWPVSHTMNSTIKLKITLDCDLPPGSKPLKGTLLGLPSHGTRFEKKGVTLRPGKQTIVLVESESKLPEVVQQLSFDVKWYFGAPLCLPIIGPSRIPVFLTMGIPQTVPEFPGVTMARMRHSVKQVSGAKSNDPHDVIRHILIHWVNANKLYNVNVFHRNAWNIGSREVGDCDSISRFIRNVILMVGAPGHLEAVRVWTRLKKTVGGTETITPNNRRKLVLDRVPRLEDFEIVETPINIGGLEDPALGHPTKPWELALIDDVGSPNDYEACIKFAEGKRGTPMYYTPGTADTHVAHESIGKVIKYCFVSISWVDMNNTSMITEKLINVAQLPDPAPK